MVAPLEIPDRGEGKQSIDEAQDNIHGAELSDTTEEKATHVFIPDAGY